MAELCLFKVIKSSSPLSHHMTKKCSPPPYKHLAFFIFSHFLLLGRIPFLSLLPCSLLLLLLTSSPSSHLHQPKTATLHHPIPHANHVSSSPHHALHDDVQGFSKSLNLASSSPPTSHGSTTTSPLLHCEAPSHMQEHHHLPLTLLFNVELLASKKA